MRIECASRAFTLDAGNTIRMADWSRASSRVVLFSSIILLLQQRLWSRNTANSQEQELLKMVRSCRLPSSHLSSACINSLLMTSGIAYAIRFDAHWIHILKWIDSIRIECAFSWCASDKAQCEHDQFAFDAHRIRLNLLVWTGLKLSIKRGAQLRNVFFFCERKRNCTQTIYRYTNLHV